MAQKENTTLQRKATLRHELLKQIDYPIVLETHGGIGRIWEMVYSDLNFGVVIENDAEKVDKLARQRPTWAVYEGDSEEVIAAGLAAHIPINFIDVDPYGNSWETLTGWFESDRARAPRLGVVVNDGLRVRLRVGRAWHTKSMEPALAKFGNREMFSKYLDVCQWNLSRLGELAGYKVTQWTGYYTGKQGIMTHFAALLERGA